MSVAVHATIVALIVWASANFNRPPVINSMAFDIVDIDELEVGEKTQLPGPPNGPPALGVPNVKYKRAKIPAPPKPQPQIAEAPANAANSPNNAKNQPAPKPNQKGVSYDQFKKQNAKDLAKNAQANNARSTGKTPRINSKAYEEAMAGAASGNNASKATIAALDKYFAKLNRALQMAFALPPGVSDQLEADVEFYLAADGTLSAVRIVKSSGDREFDAAVIEAFRKVRSIGPVPSGKGGSYSIAFNVNDAG